MNEDKKIKILTISDHPLAPSGVGTQTKYFIEALLKTSRQSGDFLLVAPLNTTATSPLKQKSGKMTGLFTQLMDTAHRIWFALS